MTPDQQPLTKQDLHEALDALVQTLSARLDATDSRLDAIAAKQDATDSRLDAAVQSFNARLDAAVQTLIDRQERMANAVTHALADLRRELIGQIDILHNRTERTEINISSILMQLAGMNKALGALSRSEAQTITQAAQQRAIDDLYAQIAELKRRMPPPQ
jgi:chaperonin cofactor prefoldin